MTLPRIAAVLFTTCLFLASAADVTGQWKATYTIPSGETRESTFDLKADGAALTGKVISARGETPITDGKVSGDEVSFSVTRNFGGNDIKLNYKGKVSGDEMKLAVSAGERSFDITAKRIK